MKKHMNINMFEFLIIIYTFVLITTIDSSSPRPLNCTINNLSFTNQTYTGYIGENVLQQSATSAVHSTNPNDNDPNSNKWRRNTKSAAGDQSFKTQPSKSYIRFVDYLKPAVLLRVNEPASLCCSQVGLDELGLSISLAADYYESFALDTFQLDTESYLCTARADHECICYFKIQLTSDLNREAVEMYKFQLGSSRYGAGTSITVQVLDDNDLEPMFEPSEYELELPKYALDEQTKRIGVVGYVPFTPITRLVAFDPDLDRNSMSRYYLKTPSNRFLLDWYTGDLYLKRRLGADDFDHHDPFVQFEVKAIDNGVKYSLINSLIKYGNSNRLIETQAQLIQTAARLNLNASLVRQLPKLNSFESGQVKIAMRDNLAQLVDLVRAHIRLIDASIDLTQTVAESIPFKLIRIDDNYVRDVRLRLGDTAWFSLLRIAADTYSVNVRLDEIFTSVDVNVTVDLVAPDDQFAPLLSIQFRASDVYTRLCACQVRASHSRLLLDRFNVQPNLLQVKVEFSAGWQSICARMADNRVNFTTNHTAFRLLPDGLLKLIDYSALGKHITLEVNARLVDDLNMPQVWKGLECAAARLDVEYSTRHDALYELVRHPNDTDSAGQVDLVRLDLSSLANLSNLFEFNAYTTRSIRIVYCDDGQQFVACPFYVSANRLRSKLTNLTGVGRSMNLLLKLTEQRASQNSSRYVHFVLTHSTSEQVVHFRPQSSIAPALHLTDFMLVESTSDCYSLNLTNGHVQFNCNRTQTTPTRLVISAKQDDLVHYAYLTLVPDVTHRPAAKYSFTESLLDSSKIQKLINHDRLVNLTQLNVYLAQLGASGVSQPGSLAVVEGHNRTAINLTYVQTNTVKADTIVWKIDRDLFVPHTNQVTVFELAHTDLFKLDNCLNGEIRLAVDRPLAWSGAETHRFAVTIIQSDLTQAVELTLDVTLTFRIDYQHLDETPPAPKLPTRSTYELKLDYGKVAGQRTDILLLELDFKPSPGWNYTYSMVELLAGGELPFYVDGLTGNVYFQHPPTNMALSNEYKFCVRLTATYVRNEQYRHERDLDVRMRLVNYHGPWAPSLDRRQIIASVLLDIDVTSVDYFYYLKSPLIGFISPSTESPNRRWRLSNTAPVDDRATKGKSSRKADGEQRLLHECFLKYLDVELTSRGLYFNLTEHANAPLFLLSKWSRLIRHFYYERNQTSRLVRLDLVDDAAPGRYNTSLYVELIFRRPVVAYDRTSLTSSKFRIQSDNLLNLFQTGDEFVVSIQLEENSPEPILINLRDYLRANLRQSKKLLLQMRMLDELEFELDRNDAVDDYFNLDNGLILTRPMIQFDYERRDSYVVKVLVRHPINREEVDYNVSGAQSTGELVFSADGRGHREQYTYWLDVVVNVQNQLDEPFVCSQPYYKVHVDENEPRGREVMRVEIVDFESRAMADDGESRFRAEIISGNSQGLFGIEGLTMMIQQSTRAKLDRESRADYELDVKVIDTLNSTRFALCKVGVTLDDLNDNRPIVNDLELTIYDRLDVELINRPNGDKLPLANAIAIDQDLISKLTYSLVSVRINDEQVDASLAGLFRINASNGNLYYVADEPQLPCAECKLEIFYKASDVGRGKTRFSRKSSIKFSVKQYPSNAMVVSSSGTAINDGASTVRTFDLADDQPRLVQVDLDENTKLGEKVYQIRTLMRTLSEDNSIVYYCLLDETNPNQTFYLTNHDGSLYLIKQLDADQPHSRTFNLTVLMTNWLGQVEHVHLEIRVRDVNDNRPLFDVHPATVKNISHTIDVDRLDLSSFQLVPLALAHDADELDEGKLSFKLEDCFYLSSSILIKKPFIPAIGVNPTTNHLNYPLCSKQYVELAVDATNNQVSLQLNALEFKQFIHNSTDFDLAKGERSLMFNLELSVRDSSLIHSQFLRVRLSLILTGADRSTQKTGTFVYKPEVDVHEPRVVVLGQFKKSTYRVELDDVESLKAGSGLIHMFNEFVRRDEDDYWRSFRPFELKFSLVDVRPSRLNGTLAVEPNSGLVYLNRTLLPLEEFIIDVKVACRGLTTRLLIVMSRSLLALSFPRDLVDWPVWHNDSHRLIQHSLDENLPIGSRIDLKLTERLDGRLTHPYDVEYHLDAREQTLFSIEPLTGVLIVQGELDYEKQPFVRLNIRPCLVHLDSYVGLKNATLCMTHSLAIHFSILNRNDNQPTMRLITPDVVNITRPGDLIPAMSLFKFDGVDLDQPDRLEFTIVDVRPAPGLAWFELVRRVGSPIIVKLTDLGYETFVKLDRSMNVECVVEVNDGLFSNRASFYVNLNLNHTEHILSMRSNPVVPVLRQLDVVEGDRTAHETLVDLNQILAEQTVSVLQYELLNYEDVFMVDSTGSLRLATATATLDRETRDRYELFVKIRPLLTMNDDWMAEQEQIRLVVNVLDVDDNRPQWVDIPYLRQLNESHYELNRTYRLTDLMKSNRHEPLLTVRAVDVDQDAVVAYWLVTPGNQKPSPLQVDRKSGAVFYANQPVHELTQSMVIVANTSASPLCSYLYVRFNFIPHSDKPVYYLRQTLFEFGPMGGELGPGMNDPVTFAGRVLFSIVDGDPAEEFNLDPLSGALSPRRVQNIAGVRLLTVQVEDLDQTYASNATVQVTGRLAVSSLAGRFDQFEYRVTVRENLAPMSEIFRFEPGSAIKLMTMLDLFYLDERTGRVYNKITFDYESDLVQTNQGRFLLHVAERAPGGAWCYLLVEVENVNDQRPQFEKLVYFAQVEYGPIGEQTVDGSVRSVLLDPRTSATRNATHQFVTKVSAKDVDSPLLFYSLTAASPTSQYIIETRLFSIEPSTGIVYLSTENYSYYLAVLQPAHTPEHVTFNLLVTVSDTMHSQTVRLNVRVQNTRPKISPDQTPKFKSLTKTITLIVAKNDTTSRRLADLRDLVDVSNLGQEWDVEFSMVGVDNRFQLEEGYVLMMPSSLWVDRSQLVDVPVLACLKTSLTICDQMVLKLNMTVPPPPAQAQTTSGDQATPAFAYSYGAYTIQQNFGATSNELADDAYDANERFYFEFKIPNARAISRVNQLQQRREFELIECTYTSLNITLANQTLAKQLKQFTHMKAHFALARGQVKQLFSLSKLNGVLSSRRVINQILPGVYTFKIGLKLIEPSTNRSSEVDQTHFKLIIVPSANSTRSHAALNVFKFDREFYKFKLSDRPGQLRLVSRLKKSATPNVDVKYRLVGNGKHNLTGFELDPHTGWLTYDRRQPVPASSWRDEELILYALAEVDFRPNGTNLTLAYMCEIYVDLAESERAVNKPPPSAPTEIKFAQMNIDLTLDESVDKDTVVYRLVALIDDELQRSYLSYSLDESDHFEINRRTGELKLFRPLNARVELNVSACLERIHCAWCRIRVHLVDLNNNPPEFELTQPTATVREDALPGTVVTTLRAVDVDSASKLEYYLIDGDHHNQFAISSDGKLYTTLLVDKERIDTYSLRVLAFDGRYKSLTTLNVTVMDVSDKRPECLPSRVDLNLTENQPVGVTIVELSQYVLNYDRALTALRYELTSIDGPFELDQSTGRLSVAQTLDAELRRDYELFVRVSKDDSAVSRSDWLSWCMIQLRVGLVDLNDNRPEFASDSLTLELVENSPNGTVLARLMANDPDSGANGIVRYGLIDSPLMQIDAKSGLVRLNTSSLDREILGDWLNFTAFAYNPVDPSARTLLNVSVNLIDVNDHVPKFEQAEYFVTVQENLPFGFVITQVSAVDRDLNARTHYRLGLGDDGPFVIDRETGQVTLNGTLDYEARTHYVLRVQAVDLADEQEDETKLVIDVLDVNDNPPVFDPLTPVDFHVNENSAVNTTIYNLRAFDFDKTAENSRLMYRILPIGDGQMDLFDVDELTGRLYVKRPIDYELLVDPNLTLTVECSDRAVRGALKADLTINVHVLDVNDNAPEFERLNQTLIFKENYPLGQEMSSFRVNDRDSVSSDAFTFAVVEQDGPEGLFAVRPNGSLFLTRRPVRNRTYVVRLRCYDSGVPPLYADTFLTVKITDEDSHEPVLHETVLDVVTIGDAGVYVKPGNVLGELKATDEDSDDRLVYSVHGNTSTSYVDVNKLSGIVSARQVIRTSVEQRFDVQVTDEKFLVESKLTLLNRNLNPNCLVNSLYVKFTLPQTVNMITVLKQFKLVLTRLISQQLKHLSASGNVKYDVLLIAVRRKVLEPTDGEDENLLDSFADLDTDEGNNSPDDYAGQNLVEILFGVTKVTPNANCLNAKQISKMLNKRKAILIKRLKTTLSERLRLTDMSFNHACKTSGRSICTTNVALKECKLQLVGYNEPLCEHTNETRCLVLPRHEWQCEPYASSDELGDQSASADECDSSNPCQNNAICRMVRVRSKLQPHCFCPVGFRGKYCDEDVDECDVAEQPAPCTLDAKCINTHGSYICNCTREPSSSCYSSSSPPPTPKYSASVAEIRNLKRLHTTTTSTFSLTDESDPAETVRSSPNLNILGQTVSVSFVQQTLLGVFSAICVVLVLLSLVAAILCRINMSRSRGGNDLAAYSRPSVTNGASTDSTNEPDFGSSSNQSSPKQPQPPGGQSLSTASSHAIPSRFSRNKQRTSMTQSLLSSHTNESSSVYENNNTNKIPARRNYKYSFNNLLFSKLRQPKTTAAASKSTPVETLKLNIVHSAGSSDCSVAVTTSPRSSSPAQSSASSSPVSSSSSYDNSIGRSKTNRKLGKQLSTIESSCLLSAAAAVDGTGQQVDTVDKYLAIKKSFSTSGHETTSLNIVTGVESSSLIRPKKQTRHNTNVPNFSSFGRDHKKAKAAAAAATAAESGLLLAHATPNNLDESLNATTVNAPEDCSLGFYWDITDWATQIDDSTVNEPQNELNQLNSFINTMNSRPLQTTEFGNLVVKESGNCYSPIYSQVFKNNQMAGEFDKAVQNVKSDLETNSCLVEDKHDDEDDINQEPNEEFKLNNLLKVKKNYMYLVDDLDKTFESTYT